MNPSYAVLTIQVGLGIFLFLSASIFLSQSWGAPWVTTPHRIVHRMLTLSESKAGDKLIDLGAGDGRILIAAAKDFKLDAIGIEIDPLRCFLAKIFIAARKLSPQPKIIWGNMLDLSLRDADIITIYLTRRSNDRLREHFEAQCSLGTKIASYSFPIKEWTPIIIDDSNLIFIYEIGKTGAETEVTFV